MRYMPDGRLLKAYLPSGAVVTGCAPGTDLLEAPKTLLTPVSTSSNVTVAPASGAPVSPRCTTPSIVGGGACCGAEICSDVVRRSAITMTTIDRIGESSSCRVSDSCLPNFDDYKRVALIRFRRSL